MNDIQTEDTSTVKQETTPVRAYAPRSWVREYLGGISVSTLRRLEKDPAKEFPRPLRFGKTPLFNMNEIITWASSHRD